LVGSFIMSFRRDRFPLIGIAAVAWCGFMTVAAASEPDPSRGGGEQTAGGTSARRRREREIDELRRQDLAQTLAEQGIAARWQDHSLAELTDWHDRIDAARALHTQYSADLDWRAFSLPALIDMRLRAAKAEQLQTEYQITVDWRVYAWGALERLRVSLAAIHPAVPPPVDHPAPTPWDSDALAPFDPTRVVEHVKTNLYDPDAIIEPLFASETWSTSSWRSPRFGLDPDAILAPSFEKVAPHVGEDGDDLIDPWNAR
jgi:hypothetical protein